MDIAIPGKTLIILLVGIIVLITAIIFIMKGRFSKSGESDLQQAFASRAQKSPLEGRNKYPEVDAFRLSGTFFNFGLLAALGIAILAFSWTSYEDEVIIPDNALELDEEIEIEPPRTAEPPPPPPPP
ncbi:MAG: energy transducer TonB, partial [Bacteroidota bacterium]